MITIPTEVTQASINILYNLGILFVAMIIHEYGHYIPLKLFNIDCQLDLRNCRVKVYDNKWKVERHNKKWYLGTYNLMTPKTELITRFSGIIVGFIPLIIFSDIFFIFAYSVACLLDSMSIINIILSNYNKEKPLIYKNFERFILRVEHGNVCDCKTCSALKVTT
jgi:hypothetical protein